MAKRSLRARLAKWAINALTSSDLEWLMAGSETASGQVVTSESAMRVAAFHSCIRVIAETIGSLPLKVFEAVDSGAEVAAKHPLYNLLRRRPNSWQTSMEFRETLTAHAASRGNGYAYQVWVDNVLTGKSYLKELIPLDPDAVTVKQNADYSLTYTVTRPDGTQRVFGQDKIFHLRNFSLNGYEGISMVKVARETIGKALGMQEYSAKLFQNNATPGLVLTKDGKLSQEAQDRLRLQFDSRYSGSGNAHKTMILEEGLKAEKISFSAEDTQFIETTKLTRSEICGLFRVPPHMIGDLDRATFSNIEEQSISFVRDCIRPWAARWEQALSFALFLNEERFYPEFNLEGLLRGNVLSRYQAYAIARNWGWASANDIRRKENENTIGKQGDTYLQPTNMTSADLARSLQIEQGGQNGNQK